MTSNFLTTMATLEEPEDVFSAGRPLYYFLKLTGLAPFTCTFYISSRMAYSVMLHQCAWSMLYSIFILIVMIVAQVVSNFWKFRNEFQEDTFPFIITNSLHGNLCFATTILSVIFGLCRNTYLLQEILNIFSELDLYLLNHRFVTTLKRTNRYVLVELFSGFVVIMSCIVVDVLVSDTEYTYFVGFGRDLSFIIIMALQFYYTGLLKIVRQYFITVNEQLQIVIGNLESSPVNAKRAEHHFKLFRLSGAVNTNFPEHANAGTCKIHNDIERLCLLRYCHAKLHHVSNLIMRMFGLPLLLQVAFYFVTILMCIYVLVKERYLGDDVTKKYMVIAWTLVAIFSLVELTANFQLTSDEAYETSAILSRLRANPQDKELSWTLAYFALHLLHSKVTFAICDFLPVDFTLLFSVTGAMATYLVIMLQYHESK